LDESPVIWAELALALMPLIITVLFVLSLGVAYMVYDNAFAEGV
jgi:hypothetical protein